MGYQDTDVTTLTVYDTLPYTNDQAIVMDGSGSYRPRGSQFPIRMTGPIVAPAGFTVYYWTGGLITDPTQAVTAAGWTTAPADYSQVTAFKIVMNPGTILKAQSSVSFTLPVVAPTSGWQPGQRAYNSFAVSINDNRTFLEATPVYNEMLFDIAGQKIWADGNIETARPSELTVILKRDGVEYARQTITAATGWRYTFTRLPYYNLAGTSASVYTVSELVVPPGYVATVGGYNITNTRTGTVTLRIDKNWVDNGSSRPAAVYVDIYRKIAGTADAPAYVATRTITSVNGVWSFSGTYPQFDALGNPYEYSVIEKPLPGYVTSYTTSGTSFTVVNTKLIEVTAQKTWINGPRTKPTVYFKLYRQVAGGFLEAVADAPLKTLPSGTTSVTWPNLPQTNPQSQTYIYTVKEVDAAGNDWTPPSFQKTENGLNVTNTFVIPTGPLTAQKTWVGGPAVKPTIWFQLQRQLAPTDEPVPVPGAAILMLPNGTLSVNWQNIELTDEYNNPYIFTIYETDANGVRTVPDNYTASRSGMSVTNTYAVQNGTVTAKKTWQGGPSPKPTVWFQLWREEQNNPASLAPVPGAEIMQLRDGTLQVQWNGIATETINAVPYIFTVKEVDAGGQPLTLENYQKNEAGLNVINAYVSPTGSFTVQKVWDGGPSPRPLIYLELYRQLPGQTPYEVENAPITALPDGTTSVTWTNLDLNDINGTPYLFLVAEVLADGTHVSPPNYVVTRNASQPGNTDTHTITNTYVSPKIEVGATKVWVNGDPNRPTVWFKLYRNLPGGTEEAVPEALVQALEGGAEDALWKGIDQTDKNGVPYIFTVKEVDANGAPWVPAGYAKLEEGLKVTNTYQVPRGPITAEKIWMGGPDPKPTVWFQLWRYNLHVEREPVPGLDILPLAHGTLQVTWDNTDLTDVEGMPYTFVVEETDATGDLSFKPENYVKFSGEALFATNFYQSPLINITATKTWQDHLDSHPDVQLQLYRDGAALSDPVTLEGGAASYTWFDLPKTNFNGKPYTYTVDEVTIPVGYPKTVSADGLQITNTYSQYQVMVTYVVIDENGNVTEILIPDTAIVSGVLYGTPYTTQSKEFVGYTFQQTSGDAPSGTVTPTGETVIRVVYEYRKNPPPVPPVEPPPPPPPPPEAPMPVVANAPATGDSSGLLLLLASAAIASGAVLLILLGRRRQEQDME